MGRRVKWTLCGLLLAALLAGDALLVQHLTARHMNRARSAAASAPLEPVDPLDAFRLERETLRSREEAQLNEIVYSDRSDAEIVARAQARLLNLYARSEQEATLEGILQGRGFEGALVSVGERSANVLLRREAVTQQESAVILELVMRETGLTGGNVKIIPVK